MTIEEEKEESNQFIFRNKEKNGEKVSLSPNKPENNIYTNSRSLRKSVYCKSSKRITQDIRKVIDSPKISSNFSKSDTNRNICLTNPNFFTKSFKGNENNSNFKFNIRIPSI